jgi:hypothetical protein
MRIIGAILILLALVIAIVPMFTDCQSQGKALTLESGKQVPMKCHWSGSAELALAIPLLALGILDITNTSAVAHRNLSILGVVLGVVICLVPTVLIGVCADPDMLCNSVMRPILLLAGILVVVVNLVGLRLSSRPDNPA